ncbi:hypothetical protein HDE78_001484 [Rhodanobacter sp. K2T2]|uniref:phospholipase D family protein n=1 Tax=Rhodanobacter sp. K2T2 TaxID=2723085 RepID=UPI0015C69E27|nr:phospholipase D family protein [Rhodanobacter sp. K2T2]NYE28532.1 hypothetical protein [Rhodanobacter sp. K2T2]
MSNPQLFENQQHTAQWVQQQRGKLDIAVAFWGNGAVKELKLDAAEGPLRVLLDLSAGASNPDEVERLIAIPGAEVLHLPRLHAKAFISENGVLVGSANASANGLGSEGTEATRWHELGILSDDPSAIASAQQWFERKWEAGRSITPALLKKARENWKERQRLRPKATAKSGKILAAAIADPDAFKNRGVYVVISIDPLGTKGEKDAEDYENQTGHQPHAWEGWTDIPKDADLISFTFYKGEAFKKDEYAVYYSPKKLRRHRSLVLVEPTELDGFSIERVTEWRPALTRAKDDAISKRTWKSEGGLCMDLGEFAEKFGKA